MRHAAQQSFSQLHTLRMISAAIIVLVAGTAATGLAALFAPGLIDAMAVPVGAGLILAVVLTGALLYFGYRGLSHDMRRTVTRFESSLASAHRDALTGTLTRSYFLSELKSRLRHADRQPLAYIQIDMDRLKQLNDGAGHAAGDAALQHLAGTIERTLPGAIAGRLGGDEFGVIVPGHDNRQAIGRVCQQLLDTLSIPTIIANRHTSISATIGFAIAPHHAGQTDDLISKADLALYQGKKSGRNTVVAFDEEMLRDMRYGRFIERELRAAILMEELDLHYQPIFASDGETLRSYEALVRWNHPVRGLIPPAEFITIAESGELIDKLGDWVLRRACADFTALNVTQLSVNVSPIQLRRPDYAERFVAILADAGVPTEAIAVEITETVPLAAEGVEMANLDRIKSLGVRIAIDDFGSGNASLSYLRRSSFEILKIDRSYVENIAASRLDAMVVAAICRIARAGNMIVVAEGIENEEQMRAVTAAGATALQGFYLGRPQPLHAILAARRKAEAATAA